MANRFERPLQSIYRDENVQLPLEFDPAAYLDEAGEIAPAGVNRVDRQKAPEKLNRTFAGTTHPEPGTIPLFAAGLMAIGWVGQTQIEWEQALEASRAERLAQEDLRLANVRLAIEINKRLADAIGYATLPEAIEAASAEIGPAPTPQTAPPLNAQFLLDLFLPEERCEEFRGDLEERYHRKLPRLGKARADWWYRKQVATSLWPLLCGFLRRTSKGSLAHVLCFLLRLAGQASWADALRGTADEEKKRSI